jgi:hypothetical protein
MNRVWYYLASYILIALVAVFFFKRRDIMAALQGFGPNVPKTSPAVSWEGPSNLPVLAENSGDRRLRHVIGRLLVPGAIAYEAVLHFDSEQELHDFLKNSGRLKVLASNDRLKSARVSYGEAADLSDIPENADSAPNYLVQLPSPPNTDAGIQDGAVPFGNESLSWLGVDGDISQWGAGITIAVVDTGVEAHPTFNENQVSNGADLLDAPSEVNGHGTAVASVAAGNHPGAPGVAPAADLLSFRVADADGNSDSFTLAEGILAATLAGSDVINISLGSTGDSSVVSDAVAYALEQGSTIVAAAGNNGGEGLTYPAAYEGVISVGSVDALGQHLDFSNTSDDLDIAAPGYSVSAAWPGEQVIDFTGTSASAPFVSGAIAAIQSWDSSLSGSEAYEQLLLHSNEAGAPGFDAQYGEGILNVGRVTQQGEAGIYDAAVASHHYAGDIAGNGREILQVLVENRGTEIVYASTLNIESPTGTQQFTIGALKPGDVVSREVVVNTRLANLQDGLSYDTMLTLPDSVTDRQPSNNQLSSNFSLPSVDESTELKSGFDEFGGDDS